VSIGTLGLGRLQAREYPDGRPALVKRFIRRIPVLGPAVRRAYRSIIKLPPPPAEVPFTTTVEYWEARYSAGGDSGPGSYSQLGMYKAEFLNAFVREHGIRSVIEFGCGDGHQLGLARYPRYTGLDVSPTIVARCRRLFAKDPTKTFRFMGEYSGETAELALSLDVIFHLVEDQVYEDYMRTLFAASSRFVIVYSSNTDENRGFEGTYQRQHRFTDWVDAKADGWRLTEHVPNRFPYSGDARTGSFSDFYVFERP
jgi:SAM-dependent methyltransferase